MNKRVKLDYSGAFKKGKGPKGHKRQKGHKIEGIKKRLHP
jgi:hypothetical protein